MDDVIGTATMALAETAIIAMTSALAMETEIEIDIEIEIEIARETGTETEIETDVSRIVMEETHAGKEEESMRGTYRR